MSHLDTPRVRFNSGYWEGVADVRERRSIPMWEKMGVKTEKHFDQIFIVGWEYGKAAAKLGLPGDSSTSSNGAWKEYQQEQKDAKESRRVLKAMRPSKW